MDIFNLTGDYAIEQGSDFLLDINYRQPVILADDAFQGDTSIFVFPTSCELVAGRKLVFPNQRVTVATTAAVGATSLTVSSLAKDSLISINPDIAATQNDFPVNLTGYTVQSQIREGYADDAPTVLAQFSYTITADVATGINSVIRLTLPSNPSATWNTSDLVPTVGTFYKWDLDIISAGGERTTILSGDVEVSPEVTRV